jgi:hypothetical protein
VTTIDPLIGERWTSPPRYIDHPPASSSLLDNGSAFDAATEMLIRNNCAHLAEESLRQLVLDISPNQLSKVAALDGWSGLADEPPPSGSWTRPNSASLISWDQRTAIRVGPFPLIVDRTIPSGTGPADGAITIRKVRVRIDCTVTDATTQVLVALTIGDGSSPIDFFATGSDTFGLFQSSTPGVSAGVLQYDLTCTVPGDQFPRSPSTCRPNATHGATEGRELSGYLWVGAYHPAGIDLWSVSAYEIL